MTRTRQACALALLVCTLGAPAAAAQDHLARRVSLDIKAMTPADAFKVIADAIGTTVSVDPGVTSPVDILVRNVSARTALNTICESIGCKWSADAAGITVKPGAASAARGAAVAKERRGELRARVRRSAVTARLQGALKQPLPPGMVFQNAPLADLNKRLSEALGFSITLQTDDPALQTVTGDFSGMTLQAVLKTLMERAGSRKTVWRLGLAEKGSDAAPSLWIMVGAAKPKK